MRHYMFTKPLKNSHLGQPCNSKPHSLCFFQPKPHLPLTGPQNFGP